MLLSEATQIGAETGCNSKPQDHIEPTRSELVVLVVVQGTVNDMQL